MAEGEMRDELPDSAGSTTLERGSATLPAERLSAHTAAVPTGSARFGEGPEYLLGVEEELMLIDARTAEPADAVEPILRAVGDAARIKPELMQCQIEIATHPVQTSADALDELRALRRQIAAVAEPHGVRLAAAGTHPWCLAEEQSITNRARYRELIAEIRYPVQRELCFGTHVHVSVGSGDKALAVIEAMLAELPLLLALSASSPFWRGEASGLQSTRTIVFQAMPRSGIPHFFRTWRDFQRSMEQLMLAGAVPNPSYIWWDVRPNPVFGTVEVRAMDAQPRAEDTAAIAGLVHALIRHHGTRYDHGVGGGRANRFVIAENRWLAARHGLRAPLVDPTLHSTEARTARVLIEELLGRIAPDAAQVGASWALDRVAVMLDEGTSADRQLKLHRRGKDLAGVLSEIADVATS